jgi:hypothetical protein
LEKRLTGGPSSINKDSIALIINFDASTTELLFIHCFQWAVLIKKHAEVVVDDEVVLPEFQKHCRVYILIFVCR